VGRTALGAHIWLRPSDEWWRKEASPAAADSYTGKYLRASQDDPRVDTFSQVCDTETLFAGFDLEMEEDVLVGGPEFFKGEETFYRGTPVVKVRAEVEHREDGPVRFTFLVAREGKPYLLHTATEPGDQSYVQEGEFTEYGVPVDVQAPPPEQTVELDDLDPEEVPL
jgi:hypothetical protein